MISHVMHSWYREPKTFNFWYPSASGVHRVYCNSPDDEAFYGLGQHQADEFNYKGKNEELFQYNTKVSVPFIVSNKNYGILWDSYSLCRFGDPRDYAQLSAVLQTLWMRRVGKRRLGAETSVTLSEINSGDTGTPGRFCLF